MDEDEYDEGTPNPCDMTEWWDRNVRPSLLGIGTRRVVNVLAQLENIRAAVEKINRVTTSNEAICPTCQWGIAEGLRVSRNRFWKKLPSFFDLGEYPDWGKS